MTGIKLYILRCIFDFESTAPIGVFTTLKKALKEFDKVVKNKPSNDYGIYEFVADKIEWNLGKVIKTTWGNNNNE